MGSTGLHRLRAWGASRPNLRWQVEQRCKLSFKASQRRCVGGHAAFGPPRVGLLVAFATVERICMEYNCGGPVCRLVDRAGRPRLGRPALGWRPVTSVLTTKSN